MSKASTQPFELQNRDWRAYFQQDELETAFQVVEIEKRDIPEEDSSAGSNSDPSDDNLDPDEILQKVYNLPESKTQKILSEQQAQKSNL